MSKRKPLSGVGLLAKCLCYLKRERQRAACREYARTHKRVRVKKKPTRAKVHLQHIRDEAKLVENCERLVAYLLKERTASQPDCARAMHMTRQVWDNFLTEATWRLPIYEDDCGSLGLCKACRQKLHLTKAHGVR